MQASIVGLGGLYKGRSAPLAEGRITIGRDPLNSMRFDGDQSISRFHAALFFEGGEWWCTDLGSTNGTLLNGKPVPHGATCIEPGSVLQIGLQQFRIDYERKQFRDPATKLIPPPRLLEPQAPVPAPPPLKAPPPRPPVVTVREPVQPNVQRATAAEKPKLASSKPPQARWFGFDDATVLFGLIIRSPLTYVGTQLVENSRSFFQSEEPSLINPKLPVHFDGIAEPLPYWPSYKDMSDSQRGQYLQWLAGGRRGEIDQGYLFVLFYGWERRLSGKELVGVDPNERSAILREIKALRHTYPNYRSYHHYSGRLLMANWGFDPTLILDAKSDDWEGPEDFGWFLASVATHTDRLTVEYARAWLSISRRSLPRHTVVNRAWAELSRLFELRFEKSFPEGLALKALVSNCTYEYRAANKSLMFETESVRLPCAAHADAILVKLKELAAQCIEDLNLYSKKLGDGPGDLEKQRAIASLPAELRTASPLVAKLSNWLAAQTQEGALALVPLKTVLKEAGFEYENSKRTAFIEVCSFLGELGYIVEPDPRFGAGSHALDANVAIERASVPVGRVPSRDFLAVLPVATMAASVALADGTYRPDEAKVIFKSVTGLFTLDQSEKERLEAYIAWFADSKIRVGKAVADKIDSTQKVLVGQILVDIALADGVVSLPELKELVRLYKLLGIPEQALYSRVNTGSEPVSVLAPKGEPGFAIPSPTPSAPKPIVDMGSVQQKLRDTERVSALLAEVFVEDSVQDSPVFTPLPDSTSKLGDLLRLLRPGEIDATEFARLASRVGMLKNGAIEALNDASFEVCGAPLIEGDDPLEIDEQAFRELTA